MLIKMAMVLINKAIVIQQINYRHQYINQRGLDNMLAYMAGQFRHFARSEEFCMDVIELWTGRNGISGAGWRVDKLA